MDWDVADGYLVSVSEGVHAYTSLDTAGEKSFRRRRSEQNPLRGSMTLLSGTRATCACAAQMTEKVDGHPSFSIIVHNNRYHYSSYDG